MTTSAQDEPTLLTSTPTPTPSTMTTTTATPALSPTRKTKLPIILGAGLYGDPSRFEGARVTTLPATLTLLDIFQSHGHRDIDTSRIYSAGSSEEYLAAAHWQSRGLNVRDKLYPTKGKPLAHLGPAYSLSPADVRRGFEDCLTALGAERLDLFILYAPDRATPIEDTLRAVNALHAEGRFDRLGIANYAAWEVARIMELCTRHGWVKPVIYQGVYNVLSRGLEPELVPCLRAYGLALHAGQPLAGGFLTARYTRDFPPTAHEPGSRFDPACFHGRHHRARYWHGAYFDALEAIRAVGRKHGLSEVQCAMRWLSHHSALDVGRGDAVIVCGVTEGQLEEDLGALEEGPLPEEVVRVLEEVYAKVRGLVGPYFH